MVSNDSIDDARTGGVTAVARAIDILRALGESPGEMTLAQISEQAGLPRSTVHRIIQTLKEASFVTSGPGNSGLRLGPELARLAAVSRIQLVPMVRPYLEQLARRVGEGASLAVLDGDSVRFLDQAVVGYGLRAISLVGSSDMQLARLAPLVRDTAQRITRNLFGDRR